MTCLKYALLSVVSLEQDVTSEETTIKTVENLLNTFNVYSSTIHGLYDTKIKSSKFRRKFSFNLNNPTD